MAYKAFFLDDVEKDAFLELLRRVASFSCVELLAWCVMSNHFHLLVFDPPASRLSDAEVREKIAAALPSLLGEGPKCPSELREHLGIASRNYFTATCLKPLVASGYIEPTDPDHPHASAQTYRITKKGENLNA